MSSKAELETLIARYLDPYGRWTRRDDDRLLAIRASSAELREHFDRVVAAYRLTAGGDAATPTAVERRRLQARVIGSFSEEQAQRASGHWSWTHWLRVLVPAVAAGAALWLISDAWLAPPPANRPTDTTSASRGPFGPPGVDDRLTPRGGESTGLAGLGIGLSGVTEAGTLYEGGRDALFVDDYLRVSLRCQLDSDTPVAIIGLQPKREPIWYFPSAIAETAPRIACDEAGRTTDFEDEIGLSAQHVAGPLVVVAVAANPLNTRALVAALGKIEFSRQRDEVAWTRAIADAMAPLGTQSSAVRLTRIENGSKTTPP